MLLEGAEVADMDLFSIDPVSGWISNKYFIDADSALIRSQGSVFSLQVLVSMMDPVSFPYI